MPWLTDRWTNGRRTKPGDNTSAELKLKTEDSVTWGVHRSDMGPLGLVVSKLYADENPLISIENVYCCCDLKTGGQTNLVDVLGRSSPEASTLMKKICQTQRWQFVPTSQVQNMKALYDPGDLENKVKVKIMTCNKMSCNLKIIVCICPIWDDRLPLWCLDV